MCEDVEEVNQSITNLTLMEAILEPQINSTEFGSIIINDDSYDYDILINTKGMVKKRQKKLSKNVHGTSHILSLLEAEYIYEEGIEKVIIGSGQEGILTLSDDAQRFFDQHHCKVEISPTPLAVDKWNKEVKKSIGLFHITC